MTQKLMLVKYELEGGIPIDETSENLQSAFIPNEFIDWIVDRNWFSEMEIKESKDGIADIPVTAIDDSKDDVLHSILLHIEAKLFECIKEAHSHITSDLIISKELENNFSDLHIWLNVREIVKVKAEKYRDCHNIKLIVG